MKIMATPYPIVYVRWIDSGGHTGQGGSPWVPAEQLDHDVIHCTSVGWLLSKTKDTVTVAAHITNPDQEHAVHLVEGAMTIPRKAITKMWTIEVPE